MSFPRVKSRTETKEFISGGVLCKAPSSGSIFKSCKLKAHI